MKRDKFLIIFTISTSLFVLSFLLGYQLMIGDKDEVKLSKLQSNEKSNNSDNIAIIKEEQKITPNTIIEQRTLYKECGDLISTNAFPSSNIVNMNKDEYNNYLSNESSILRIVSFSSNKIVIWGEKDSLCTNHFIIGEENGNIAVFKIDSNGNKVIYKKFDDYPLELLMELDQEKIKKGIRVDSEEELSDVLENFIS